MRTLSVSPVSADPDAPDDLDGFVVDGVESLRQRIVQRLRFPRGEWQLSPTLGTDRLLGRRTAPRLAAAVVTSAILDEGGDEVLEVSSVNVNLDHETRELRYTATISTVYGRMVVAGPVL